LYANPAEEQGAIWMVVGSGGSMSRFTDYRTQELITNSALVSRR